MQMTVKRKTGSIDKVAVTARTDKASHKLMTTTRASETASSRYRRRVRLILSFIPRNSIFPPHQSIFVPSLICRFQTRQYAPRARPQYGKMHATLCLTTVTLYLDYFSVPIGCMLFTHSFHLNYIYPIGYRGMYRMLTLCNLLYNSLLIV